ncbi:hypothetical protein F5B22DRAFT_641819 [Xylaria bambusicola]|uniref:uncharacterized protein n=1 Tax=Xylaria bambusicola TaxID=326684 RepID=UPI00200768A5|nr:uncharacterized protein F5B22DRAFT_641819 [Xylaria bambusicola]KAI0526679.1 hypothetical protein F5B22DRAFT_641819 [Xylaria bambusicola]
MDGDWCPSSSEIVPGSQDYFLEDQQESKDSHAPPSRTSSGGLWSVNKKPAFRINAFSANSPMSSPDQPGNHRHGEPQAPMQPLTHIRANDTSLVGVSGVGVIPDNSIGHSKAAAPSLLSLIPNKLTPITSKLTPITGRVSRAKKGVLVHRCEQCNPPKTFTRAEHLRRHQLSHKSPTAFICCWPGCDKVFHRQDLLDRHTQRHEQDERARQVLTIETKWESGLAGWTTIHDYALFNNSVNYPNGHYYNAFRKDNYRFPPASSSTADLRRRDSVRNLEESSVIGGLETATDSGYGSQGQSQRKIQMRDTIRTTLQEFPSSNSNDQGDDNKTEYSDARSLYNAKLEVYISEFAQELAAVLPRSISAEQLPGLSGALPDLLKAFAIKFGSEEDTHLQYRLMYLVHRYRIQISKAVIDTFTLEEQDVEDEVQRPDNAMPIHDKMLLWDRKNRQLIDNPEHGSTPVDNSDRDHEDDNPWDDDFGSGHDLSEDFPEINEYRQILLNSKAYSWLLKSVISKVELEIPAGDDNARGKIRRKILDFLSEPSKISQRRAPMMQPIVFKLPWIRNYLISQEYKSPIHKALPHSIVIVGVNDQTYVTTCGEYLETVWPDLGPQILGLCISLLSSPHGSLASCTLFDRTVVSANVNQDGSTVDFHLTGTIYSLAEIGEILVWLSAAFNCNTLGDDLVYRYPTCEIENQLVGQQPNKPRYYNTPPYSMNTKSYLNFTFIESSFQKPTDTGPQGCCWINLFGNRPVVSGYPIPRRTTMKTGAEIPLNLMAQLINARKISTFAGSIVIKGCSALLIPTRHIHDTIIWHLVFDQFGEYMSYTDPRVKNILKESVKGLTHGNLETSRHVLGWCNYALNHAGAADANYSIGWSSLKPPAPGFAFEKISIVGGMFLTAGVSTIIGKRDKAVHFKYRDDYTMRLKWISKKYVVLYDVQDRRAWLLNGASALLHLVRASLQHDLNDPFKSLCLYDESALSESLDPHSGKNAAIRVLTNPRNLDIPLYAKPDTNKVEVTSHERGRESKVLSSTKTNYCLKDRIEDICNVLEQVMAHQADTCTQDGVGFKVKASDRRHIEGFDFMDIATDEDPCFPRQITLRSSGRGWVDFIRAIHAVTLFGSHFGDLISPSKIQGKACESCHANVDLPKGQDLLAVCVSELNDILQKRGSKATTPWRLVDDIYWLTPDKTFEPCLRGQKCDRVQVLLPASFPKLWGRNFRSPGDLSQATRGALIFGHSRRFPLRWGDRGDPEQGHAEQDNELDDLNTSMQDSGIGTSLDSSSGNDAQSPISISSDSQSQERTRKRIHRLEGGHENEPKSKRQKLNNFFSNLSR